VPILTFSFNPHATGNVALFDIRLFLVAAKGMTLFYVTISPFQGTPASPNPSLEDTSQLEKLEKELISTYYFTLLTDI
jgi:hypothetical protein